MAVEMLRSKCGCKGIRTCLICECVNGKQLLLDNGQSPWHNFIYDPCLRRAVLSDGGSLSFPFSGIYLWNNFITEEEEKDLITNMDLNSWKDSQSGRRKQDFGPKVNFKKRKVRLGDFCGLPAISRNLVCRMSQEPVLAGFQPVEQCNLEYHPHRGSSIDPHLDDTWLWGERLVTINLLSDTTLTMSLEQGLTELGQGEVRVSVHLPRRSLVVVYGEARHRWKHSIHRHDIHERRVCSTYRELSAEFQFGGEQHTVGSQLLDIALGFKVIRRLPPSLVSFLPGKFQDYLCALCTLKMPIITEKLLLEKCTPKTTKLEQIKTLNLANLCLKCADLPAPLLSRLCCLEQLDLSGNRLQQLPPRLSLPSLRTLDLSNNDMEDVTTLNSLTNLEELRMEDNLYVTVTDNYKLMVLLPKLRVYNGKDISTTANHMRFVNSENLRKRVLAVWETSFSLPNVPTAEKLASVERDFVNKVCYTVKYGPSSLADYTKWRVEMIAKEHLCSLTEPNDDGMDSEELASTKENCSVPSPVKRPHSNSAAVGDITLTPVKKSRASVQDKDSLRTSSRLKTTPQKAEHPRTTTASPTGQNPATQTRIQSKVLLTQKKGLREKSQPLLSPEKKKLTTTACVRQQKAGNEITGKEPVRLQPVHVLQCHSKQDSPDDFSTQLWACAFQPVQYNNGDVKGESRIVATCGGESVCLIDCDTGLVMKKYKVPGEEFFSLAWSTVLMSREGNVGLRPCSILAAGGKRGLVKLLHPRANMAYGEFRASRKPLSVLRFSPCQGNFLFTGSYDKKIVMWDIGGVDSEYNFKVIQLLVLETTSVPLHVCLSPASPDAHLIAACDQGLHSYDIQLNKNMMKRSEDMEITFPVYAKEDKDCNYHTIDGLAFLTDDIVASKSQMQGSIYLWSWSLTQAQRANKKKVVCAVILAELQWSSTDVPYLSLNTCPSKGYVVCGDEGGRLWTYHVTDLLKVKKSDKAIPATEILEWPTPVRKGKGPVEGPCINSVAMDSELKYLVALSDKNMAIVWRRIESS
ncbi:hypothetical protein DPEC_G00224430 [Dallia pectoralis]|uniref:Uncharacterized protein n=1 Tax=Dallia pectoralis TaxID=75939 RepID=A0ACC2G0H0_DALPE|nr:hypothetical protein DPEC_G00224430 [Dallia pectoralis]